VASAGGEPSRYTSPAYESSTPLSDDGEDALISLGPGLGWAGGRGPAGTSDWINGGRSVPARSPTDLPDRLAARRQSFTQLPADGNGFGASEVGRGSCGPGGQADSVAANRIRTSLRPDGADLTPARTAAITKPRNTAPSTVVRSREGRTRQRQAQFFRGLTRRVRTATGSSAQIFIDRADRRKAIRARSTRTRAAVVSARREVDRLLCRREASVSDSS